MANYKRTSDGPNQIIYSLNDGNGCFGILFALVGLPILLTGIWLMYHVYFDGWSLTLALTFLGVGLSFSSFMIILFVKESDLPDQIIFDNEFGCIRFLHLKKKYEPKTAIIPYDEIEGFEIRARQPKNSSKPEYYDYQIYWKKRNGTWWDLTYYNNSDDAEKHLQWLKDNIHLDKKCTEQRIQILPPAIEKTKWRGHDILKWRNANTTCF